MNRVSRIACVSATAVALTLSAGGAIHAQSQAKPAYLLVEINVRDQEGFSEYAQKATETVEQYGGTFITLGENVQTIEGPEPNGTFVIIKFDSMDDARKWLNSPEYNEVKGIRHRTAEARQYLVEGLPGQ